MLSSRADTRLRRSASEARGHSAGRPLISTVRSGGSTHWSAAMTRRMRCSATTFAVALYSTSCHGRTPRRTPKSVPENPTVNSSNPCGSPRAVYSKNWRSSAHCPLSGMACHSPSPFLRCHWNIWCCSGATSSSGRVSCRPSVVAWVSRKALTNRQNSWYSSKVMLPSRSRSKARMISWAWLVLPSGPSSRLSSRGGSDCVTAMTCALSVSNVPHRCFSVLNASEHSS
mmetsp:Transcript_72930/g.194638  ORF Transcript_72930/g.194638 Transcript_72930/m.194638 type:complete len:228 (-) Transcript_72930:313-996(-)